MKNKKANDEKLKKNETYLHEIESLVHGLFSIIIY